MLNENNVNGNSVTELNDEALEQVSGGKTITVACRVSEANVRSGPGKDFSVIGHLRRGDTVTYMSEKKKDREGKIWVLVGKGGRCGWVRADLLS